MFSVALDDTTLQRPDDDTAHGSPDVHVSPDDVAYIIYTSGSTGTPKGVMVQNKSLCNQLRWRIHVTALGPADCVLHTIPLFFDPALWQLFGPLLAGASVVVASSSDCRDPRQLAGLVNSHRVSIVDFVPSMLSSFLAVAEPDALAGVKVVFCGGEVLQRSVVDALLARVDARVFNQYGPTETTIDATSWNTTRSAVHADVTIGKPIHGQRVYVCDERLSLVPVGVAGEICIGGAGVAIGYVNDPQRTAERFVPDPFSGRPSSRMYRTGDLGRLTAEGDFEYLGRLDRQIKVRGYRIEPGEIEAALLSHPSVSEARVMADQTKGGLATSLTAHIVCRDGAQKTPDGLANRLAATLPPHMVPSQIFVHASFPTTATGKVDEHALVASASRANVQPDASSVVLSSFEEQVVGLYREELGLTHFTLLDNFFALGGTSLSAIRIAGRLRALLQFEVPVSALFEHPNVASLAEYLARISIFGAGLQPLRRQISDPADGKRFSLSWPQRWIWHQRIEGTPPALLQIPVVLKLGAQFSEARLEQAIQALLDRHQALRTHFGDRDGVPWQAIRTALRPALNRATLGRCDNAGLEAYLAELADAPIDLATSGPFCATLVTREGDEYAYLAISLHKIAADGSAVRTVVSDLIAAYHALNTETEQSRSERPVQLMDIVEWENRWLEQGAQAMLVTSCLNAVSDCPAFRLPGGPVNAKPSTAALLREVSIDVDVSRSLCEYARTSNATPFHVFTAAWQVALSGVSGLDRFLLGTPLSGRDDVGLAGAVARLVNMVAIAADVSGTAQFSSVVARVRDALGKAYRYQRAPYLQIVKELRRMTGVDYPISAVINYSAARPAPVETDMFLIHKHLYTRSVGIENTVTLFVTEVAHGFICQIVANPAAVSSAVLNDLAQRLVRCLEAAAAAAQPK